MLGQLEIPGLEDALTPLDKADYLVKGSFIKALKAEFEKAPVILFEERWGGYPGYHPIQLQLFEPAPRCDQYLELDDQTLWCHLDAGHKGLHFDANYHVDWTKR